MWKYGHHQSNSKLIKLPAWNRSHFVTADSVSSECYDSLTVWTWSVSSQHDSGNSYTMVTQIQTYLWNIPDQDVTSIHQAQLQNSAGMLPINFSQLVMRRDKKSVPKAISMQTVKADPIPSLWERIIRWRMPKRTIPLTYCDRVAKTMQWWEPQPVKSTNNRGWCCYSEKKNNNSLCKVGQSEKNNFY